LRAAVVALAAGLDRPAVEPQIVVDRGAPQAPLRVQPGQAGRRLNVDQTAADLAAAFAGAISSPPGTPARVVDATFVDVPPAMDDTRIAAAKEQAAALLARPVAVAAGGKMFPLPPAAQLV